MLNTAMMLVQNNALRRGQIAGCNPKTGGFHCNTQTAEFATDPATGSHSYSFHTHQQYRILLGIRNRNTDEYLQRDSYTGTGCGRGSLFLRETFSHIRNVVFRSKFRFVTLRPFPLGTALAIASRGTTPRKTKTIEENWEVTLLVRQLVFFL